MRGIQYIKNQYQRSIVDDYPEYEFVPTSLVKSIKNKAWVLMGIGVVVLVCGTILMCGADLDAPPILTIICAILLFGLILVGIGFTYYKKSHPIEMVADYISKNKAVGKRKSLVIFVKSRKFGVLESGTNRIRIPAVYDKLLWRDKNILVASSDGMTFLIDIFGNKLS